MSLKMLQLERLNLDHVLQTVSVLESVICRSFGPEGGQVLFTRDTGQAMLSRSGTRILTALRLEHPLARMVVECVLKHSSMTGDGSKTFILLLSSILRMIHTMARKESKMSRTFNSREVAEAATARHLADELLAFALEELGDLIATGVVPYGCCVSWEDFTASSSLADNFCVQKLLASFFYTRLGCTHCEFISNLTCELLISWKFKSDQPSTSLQFVNDNFPSLYSAVSGFPISCSRLIEGQVIHKDFATPWFQTEHQPVKAVVFKEYLQPKMLSAGEILELGCGEHEKERTIVNLSASAERSLEHLFANLQSLGVSVLLSAVKQSAAVLALATQADMCIVDCVGEDELSLFSQLSGIRPVSDRWMIGPDNVATLTFCRPILLGAHRYVHVAFHDSEERLDVRPCSLVICGPGEGQTDQYACAVQDAVRMLLSTWEPVGMTAATASNRTLLSNKKTSLHQDDQTRTVPVLEPGCVIPAGGTFEFLLNRVLLQHGHSCSVSDGTNMGFPAVSQLLANALLCVPQQIYSHSPRCFLQTQNRLLWFIQNHSHPCSLVYKQEHNTVLTQVQSKSDCPLEEGKRCMHCCREADRLLKVSVVNSGLESISCKYQLLLAVLQCVSSLLHMDTVLHTHSALHTQSRRPANFSWEDTEDEADD